MDRQMRLLSTSCAVAFCLPLFAESVVKVTSPDENVISVPFTTETKITFGKTEINIANKEADVVNIPYGDIKNIKFLTNQSGSGVGMLTNRLGLKHNPVYSYLEVTGHNGKPARLTVSSLSGVCMKNIREWNGEAVDVSSFAPGVYLLSINNNTIKFVKK